MDKRTHPLILIVAMAENRGIGYQNQLPWRYPADLKYFREQTTGHTVVMGRKTCQSLPKALPNRRNIVLSLDPLFEREGFEIFSTMDDVLLATQHEKTFVIGGAQIYWLFMPWIVEAHITMIPGSPVVDTYLPRLPSDMIHSESRMLDGTPALEVAIWKTTNKEK